VLLQKRLTKSGRLGRGFLFYQLFLALMNNDEKSRSGLVRLVCSILGHVAILIFFPSDVFAYLVMAFAILSP